MIRCTNEHCSFEPIPYYRLCLLNTCWHCSNLSLHLKWETSSFSKLTNSAKKPLPSSQLFIPGALCSWRRGCFQYYIHSSALCWKVKSSPDWKQHDSVLSLEVWNTELLPGNVHLLPDICLCACRSAFLSLCMCCVRKTLELM